MSSKTALLWPLLMTGESHSPFSIHPLTQDVFIHSMKSITLAFILFQTITELKNLPTKWFPNHQMS